MNKIFTVVKREYLQIVKTKGFIISTILGPVLMAAIIVIPVIIAMTSAGGQKKIAVIDSTGEIFLEFQSRIDYKLKDGRKKYELEQVRKGPDIDSQRAALSSEILGKKISAYIFIPGDILAGGAAEYVSQHVTDFDEIRKIHDALNSVIIQRRLKEEGLEPEKVARLIRGVGLKTIKVTHKGEEEDTGGTFAISYILVLILYMSLFFYGAIIMRGVIEEKSSRVVEVILSSMRPFQLMAGKILGIAAVGLTQYLIWALFGLAATRFSKSIVSSLAPGGAGGFKMASIPPYIFVYFIVFFILGYFLYGTFYAAIGSMVNTEKEAGQLVGPISMFLIVPILMMTAVLKAPNSSLSVILSMIPFFSPILMLLRVCVLFPPVIQLAGSIVLLFLTIVLLIWLTAKIYRVGILMYGKRPALGEVIKWIRYK